MKLGDWNHKVAGNRVSFVKMLFLVLLHEPIDLANHFDELELVGASTKHGDEAFDERRTV